MIVVCPICGKENELRKYLNGKWNEICVWREGKLPKCELYKSLEKEVYWCAPLLGAREVPGEEFERWLKLRSFE